MSNLRLAPLPLGFALGLLWGVSVLAIGLVAHFFGYGKVFVTNAGDVYVGYDVTILGSLIGGALAFCDALLRGVIFAWIYNMFAGCCKRKHSSEG